MMRRAGYTLIELIITMVVASIIGTLLARMLVDDSRFVSELEASAEARQVARAAMTFFSTEAQMISSGGITEATEKRVGFIVPFGWGVACGRDGGATIGSLVPSDSMMLATAVPNTVHWLDSNENYQSSTMTLAPSSSNGVCQATDTVSVLTGGQLVAMTMPDLIPFGSIFYLGEAVRYEFRASTLIPGRWGLWREDGAGVWDELLSPFDTSSGFGYFVGINDTVNTNPPGLLSAITGIELRFVGESQMIPEGSTTPEEFELDTRVTFINR